MRAPRHTRLSAWLAGSALVVALVPALLLAAVALRDLSDREQERAAERSAQLAQAVAGEVGRFLDAQLIHLTEVRISAEGHPGVRGLGFDGQLKLHLATNPVLVSIMLVDRQGRVIHEEPDDPDVHGSDLSGQPWLREAWSRGTPTWSTATIAPTAGQPTVTLVVPGREWTVVGWLDLATLAEIAGRTRVGPAGGATVLDRDGTIIAHGEARLVREHASLRELPLVKRALFGEEGTELVELEGEARLASVATVPHTGWVVLVSEPAQAVFAKLERSRLVLLLVAAGGLAVAMLTALGLARRILGPVRALADNARALAAGGPVPALARGADIRFRELEELAESFDAMAEAVRARERALQQSEASYRRIVDNPLIGVGRTDRRGRIVFANETLARLFGEPDAAAMLGRDMTAWYQDPAQRSLVVADVLQTGQSINREVVLRRADGQPIVGLLNVALDGDTLIGMFVDITALKRSAEARERLEQQLERAQRVEAVGRLAGGVAHDLNNVLTAIIGFGHLLAEAVPPGHPERESVEGILEAAGRAADLTRSLLAFGRKQPLQPRPVDLRELVRSVAGMLRRLLGEDVEFLLDLPDEPLVAVVDPARLEQVLVNLGTNARDAMPGGGRLTVSARRAALPPGEAAALGLEGAGPWIRLAVSDTGQGMSEEVQRQAFEPFFTTKGLGKGTGLGLSIVHGIVRQHGGAVSVSSAAGAGATFTIHLPATDAPAMALAQAAAAPTTLGPGGSETILVAEDEEAVRRVVTATLRRSGYTVVEAADGAEAVARFRERRAEIGLCILDVIMPRLNGREALEAIRLLKPGTRVLLVSGFTGNVLEDRGLEMESVVLLQKPLSPSELLRHVRRALDQP
jgi:PAS domain S-box-containing protein